MGRIPIVKELLIKVLEGHELIFGFVASQVISNVPAAILLSGFTTDYPMLLRGVNIGGLGTLIASLASLISYKFYVQESEKNETAGTKAIFSVFYGMEYSLCNCAVGSERYSITYKESMIEEYRK